MRFVPVNKHATLEAIAYPILLLAVLWVIFLLDKYFELKLYRFGVLPKSLEGLKGILFMPFIHGQRDFSHIINNSIPIAILLSVTIYFYRSIAIYVITLIWLLGGFLLWAIAINEGVYHIGISGVIYGLFGFLFVSGFFKKYMPLQAISLFVVFVYGSLVWGIFPTDETISWEGHLSGLLVGVLTAFAFRKEGPVPPKYKYEIEKELGIEPPDLEGEWLERRQRFLEAKKLQELQMQEKRNNTENKPPQQEEIEPKSSNTSSSTTLGDVTINYIPKKVDKE